MSTAVALAPGVWRIPTAPYDLVNSFVVEDPDGSLTLVDAGLRGAQRTVLSALRGLGRAAEEVQRVLLTHAHLDHAGGLAGVVEGTGARVLSHDADAGYLRQGRAPDLDRTTTRGRLLMRVPRGTFARVDVDETFADGALVHGLRVVHTPGHSPGHVSLVHEATGVLITGDAVFNVRGLRYSPKSLCTDVRLSRETADRLADLEFETAAFTHGAEVRSGARGALRAFLRGRAR